MNRVVIIGNGFDLAHGLPTRYSDFINWYWKGWNKRLKYGKTRIEEDEFYSFRLNNIVQLAGWYLVWNWQFNIHPSLKTDSIDYVNIAKNDSSFCTYKEKSSFFSDICKSSKDKQWVDIETEYYNHVLSPIKIGTIKDLNDQFEIVKRKLISYLSEIQDKFIKDQYINSQLKAILFSSIKGNDIAISAYDKWKEFVDQRRVKDDTYWEQLFNDFKLNEESKTAAKSEIDRFRRILSISTILPDFYTFPDRTLILNFNYTNLADLYIPKNDRFIINHIHGQLSDPNSIIFGYGDEIDKHYSELTDKNDNEYLRHIKSYNYLMSSNYRNLLSFIESEPYQIFIMGHSCGISDRTMLNTLFEHPNCVSIKPYYHQITPDSDDYMNIVQNISRNFTDMKLMRDRVVNKTLCECLPQKDITAIQEQSSN